MLACPEVDGVWRDRLALPDNGPEANKLFLDAADQCGKRLAGGGEILGLPLCPQWSGCPAVKCFGQA